MVVTCFDLWGTLILSCLGTGASYAEALVRFGVSRETIYQIVRDELMVGRFDYDEMIGHLIRSLGIEVPREDAERLTTLWRRDNEQVKWMCGARERLSRERHVGNKLVLISNITAPAWQSVDRALGIHQHFDKVLLSCDLGFAKPDPRMWTLVEEEFPHSQYQMIGDNFQDDLGVPASRGWRTELVTKREP